MLRAIKLAEITKLVIDHSSLKVKLQKSEEGRAFLFFLEATNILSSIYDLKDLSFESYKIFKNFENAIHRLKKSELTEGLPEIYYYEDGLINLEMIEASLLEGSIFDGLPQKNGLTIEELLALYNLLNEYSALTDLEEISGRISHSDLDHLKEVTPTSSGSLSEELWANESHTFKPDSPLLDGLMQNIKNTKEYKRRSKSASDQAAATLEDMADVIFETDGYVKYDGKFGANNGIDGLYIKGSLENPEGIRIVESKFSKDFHLKKQDFA